MPFISKNPFTEEEYESFAFLTVEEITDAIKKSNEAYNQWRVKSLATRKAACYRLADLLNEQKEYLGTLACQEMGKPLKQAIGEVEKCALSCKLLADMAEEALKAETLNLNGGKAEIQYHSQGIILGIMPWNFPYWQVIRAAIPNLLLGNAFLLKHAPHVARCANALQTLFTQAGFTANLFQNIFVDVPNLELLIAHPLIRGISLTGSEMAGRSVAQLAAKHLKKVVLELGGSDPFIIHEDADIEKCVEKALQSRCLNNGQSCIAAKRFIIHSSVYEIFRIKLIHKISQLQVGNPMDLMTDIGPLARKDLAEKLQQQIEESCAAGAILTEPLKMKKPNDNFVLPCLLENIPENAVAYQEELFGPVFSLFVFNKIEDALQIANATNFGLGASVWTQDDETVAFFAEKLDSGNVFINEMTYSHVQLAFGGVKNSGFGRELSKVGFHEFANIKTVFKV